MRYATYVDSESWDQLFALWADDCVWTRPGTNPIIGPTAARAFLEQRQAERNANNPNGSLARHMVTSVRVDPIDETTADATWYALVIRNDRWDGQLPATVPRSLPHLVVEYHTSFERRAAGWQITRHDAQHVFRSGT